MLIVLIPLVLAFVFMLMKIIGRAKWFVTTEKSLSNGLRLWLWKHKETFLSFEIVFATILALSLLFMGVGHLEVASFPAQRAAIQGTVDHARASKAQIVENAAITRTIVEFNRELARIKYWSDNIWVGWYYPDHVAALAYIE